MSTPPDQPQETAEDITVLAGEFVLGTLDPAQRAAVAARRQREPALDTAIGAWEAELSPLDALTPPVEPPRGLFDQIERTLGAPALASTVELADLRRRVQGWKRLAVAATSVAAALAVGIGVREGIYRHQPQNYVAVFQKDDVLPAFYLTIDLKSRELTVRPVGAQKQQGKTYQLWIASDQLGPAPQSLGLVDDDLAPTRKVLTTFDASLLQKATFGVSLEPAGGSPTGRPTSPALHAKLLPIAD